MKTLYVKFPFNRSYGVELETDYTVDKFGLSQAIKLVDKKNPIYVSNWSPSNNNNCWHVKTDSSCGYEVASYKSTGPKDLQNIARVTDSIKSFGAQVNKKCGFHIHVEVVDFTPDDLSILISNWMKLELSISNSLPSDRVNNKYCKLLNDCYNWLSDIDLKQHNPKTFLKSIRTNVIASNGGITVYTTNNSNRRVSLNFYNYFFGIKKTVELRMPEGTLDSLDVKNWTRLFLNFVDFSKKNRVFLPENTSYSNLDESLEILGLSSSRDNNIILSRSMFEAKDWFLKRILKYSNDQKMCMDAIKNLNLMWNPVKIYQMCDDGGYFLEREYE